MYNESKAHMGSDQHLLRYHAGSIDLDITCKKGGFNVTPLADANWGNNPNNGKSTSSYVMMCNGPVSFKMGM